MAAMEARPGAWRQQVLSYLGDERLHTFPADRDWQRQSLGQICPAILIQMGDAKTHKWMMPKHG